MTQDALKTRWVAAMIGFVGGGVASIVILGMMISTFMLHFETIWPGVLIGAIVSAVLAFLFPTLAGVLTEFVG